MSIYSILNLVFNLKTLFYKRNKNLRFSRRSCVESNLIISLKSITNPSAQVKRTKTMSNLESNSLQSYESIVDYLTHIIMDYLSKSITVPTNKYLPHLWCISVESFIVRFDSIHDRRLILNWALVSVWSSRYNSTQQAKNITQSKHLSRVVLVFFN